MKDDYCGAVEQIIEACSYINWADSPVTSRFVTDFVSYARAQTKFIKTPEGELITYDEVVEKMSKT